uniref:Ragulator complex protein LAMTOR4 n=1 Tax=Latimeria chalumnae TaxID=7897 RepID=H3A3H5_LATCH
MATTLTQGLERIPDQLGYLIISEDGVLASAGELENDEHTARVIMGMVQTACKFQLSDTTEPAFKRLSSEYGASEPLFLLANEPHSLPIFFSFLWPSSGQGCPT